MVHLVDACMPYELFEKLCCKAAERGELFWICSLMSVTDIWLRRLAFKAVFQMSVIRL